jgi:ELWxxDGT repeat protein
MKRFLTLALCLSAVCTQAQPIPVFTGFNLNLGVTINSTPKNFAKLGSKFVFSAFTDANGTELWISDGTVAGTKMLKDIKPGIGSSFPIRLTPLGNNVVFVADDGTNGSECWVTDGTEAGTQMRY